MQTLRRGIEAAINRTAAVREMLHEFVAARELGDEISRFEICDYGFMRHGRADSTIVGSVSG